VPKRVDRAARREEILAAAVKVFARKGFAASRIEDVAAEAGIGKGVVYLYFDSRDELLLSVFSAYAAQTETMLASLGSGSPLGRLERLVHLVINSAAAQPDHARVLLDLWAMTPAIDDWADGPMRDMTSVYHEYRSAVADLLREAEESGETRPGLGEHHATVIVGAIEGCLLQWLIDPSIALGELAAPIVSVCIDGVRA
jgi:TetR/AcrR family fatty acid metabolism transcriptional regulator